MKVSLLISTYNWSEALEMVLKSIGKQTVMPDEILVADDGSSSDTLKIIDNFKKQSSIKLRHIWHKDDGFRKTFILNKAIAISEGDYIIQTDGDCILHPDFVKDHIRFSKPNVYLYGSRVTISKEYTKRLFKLKKINFNFLSKGIEKRTRALRIPLFSSFYKEKLALSKKLRGCNVSYWKKDFINVNGYNQEMTGWGREDSELMVRMLNNGVKSRRIRYSGIVFHIWHRVNSKHNLNKNDLIQQKAIKEKIKRCDNGVDTYLLNK